VARDVDVDPQVNAIALQRVDDRTVAWVGTARGLARIDGERTRTWSFKEGLPHHHVQALHVRDDGDVVVGTTTGFVLVRDDEVLADVHRKRPRRWAVWSITEDDEGTLWVGTTQGLIRYPVDGAWTRFSMLDGVLPDNWVTSVVVDGEHLWVGTYAGGVARVRADGDALVEPEHFGGGRINPAGLTLEGDRVWVSTMGGLRELSATDGTWREHPDATPGHDVKGVALAGDHRWVASRRGLRRH
jgi:ligand-binding sensor domain-containing protein